MAATLRFQLLQEFRIWLNDKPIDGLYQPRLQSLLAYLALHPHTPQPRHQIAYLFWPDSSEQQAQTNLRKLIHTLRQLLPNPDDLLFLDHRHVGWQEDVRILVDVAEVENALASLKASENGKGASRNLSQTSNSLAHLQRIASLYVGDLLPACYEEWVLALRSALHERVVNALADSLSLLEAQRHYTLGNEYAELLLRLDPLHERAFHHLILFRALSGNRTGAIRAYHEGAQRLDQELGVSPSQETQALYEQLIQEEVLPAPILSLAHPTPTYSPFVGRHSEWQSLLAAWRQMPKAGPHFLLIWGEAGMGKTRLVEELQQWATFRAGSVAAAHLYGAEGNLPYSPVVLWLRSAAIRPTVAKLDALWRTELLRLLPELQQEYPTLPPPAPMLEGWQQNRFYEAMARVIAAAPSPRLLILDDLQWCDSETLRWLRYLLRFDPQLPLLVIGTVRSEAIDSAHPLHELIHHLRRNHQYSELELHALDAEETTTLAKSLAEEHQSEWVEQLYPETEGNPLYIVETVRARLSNGINSDTAAHLPSTIQAVIAARLAQLSPLAQQIVELAATIGRTVSPTLLAASVESDEERAPEVNVAEGLDELWRRRILVTKNEGYDFSHDKIREVAYTAIAPMQRRRLHRKVAHALEELYAADLTMVWGQLAIHYEAAQMPGKALPYLIHMAEQAAALDAYIEADAYYGRALSLHNTHLPADKRGALDLLLKRSALIEHQRQVAGQEGEIEKMLALASTLGEPELLATTYLRQASYLSLCGDTRSALHAGDEALAIYRANQNRMGEIHAFRELGLICWSAQAYGDALRYGREVLLLHRQQSDVSGEASALHNLAEIYRSLGSPRQAIALYEEALQLYWMRRDYRRQALTLYGLAHAYRQTARHEEALRHYQKARAFCEKVGDRLILSRVSHAVAILNWEMEQSEAALQAINDAIEISRAIGNLPGIAYGLVALGYMESQLGHRQGAYQHLSEALILLNQMGDEEGIREIEKRVERLANGPEKDTEDDPQARAEPSPALNWVRGHVVLGEGKVYCEFELPALTAQAQQKPQSRPLVPGY